MRRDSAMFDLYVALLSLQDEHGCVEATRSEVVARLPERQYTYGDDLARSFQELIKRRMIKVTFRWTGSGGRGRPRTTVRPVYEVM